MLTLSLYLLLAYYTILAYDLLNYGIAHVEGEARQAMLVSQLQRMLRHTHLVRGKA